jgi:aminoglycoside phosphotransferase (APT) family kinase protein
VLRRPPFGSKVKSAHDMGREHRLLSALHPAGLPVPKPIAFVDDESIMGEKFYLMERLRGVILRHEPPQGMAIDETLAARLSDALVDALAALHDVDWRAVGLGELGKPEGFVERQVTGWSKRWQDAKTDDIPEMEAVAAWLAARLPPSPPPAIVHGDFKFDNLILDPADPARIVGILDWEMATIGDPLMDVGTSLCYWVEAADPAELKKYAFGPTTRPGFATRRRLAERYAERRGLSLERLSFYYAFGLFKTAVVAQQIYFRWKQGLTRDPRFEGMLDGARALAGQAERATRGEGL